MDAQTAAALMGISELVFGVFYALLGTGPRIPNVPRHAMFILRLCVAFPMLFISLFQWAYADEKAACPVSAPALLLETDNDQ